MFSPREYRVVGYLLRMFLWLPALLGTTALGQAWLFLASAFMFAGVGFSFGVMIWWSLFSPMT